MKPKYGFNETQSYIEFRTTHGVFRLGMEGSRIFLEKYKHGQASQKKYITNDLDEITALINEESLDGFILENKSISLLTTKRVTIDADDIIAMYTTPIVLVPAVTGVAHEFFSALIMYKRVTDSFGGGGDVTIRDGDAVVLSTTVSAANSFNNAANVFRVIPRLAAAGGYVCTPNKALVITNATGVFTKTTAAGYADIDITYKSHLIGF